MPDLKDYVSVAERVAAATHDLVSIDASPPTMLDGSMGYMRVVVTLKDGRSATGTASFKLDLQGRGAQATNPIEDCETSAVGRALALLGYHSSRSIASREEVVEAQRREVQGAQPRANKPNAPMSPAEAQRRFFAKYGDVVGAAGPDDWAAVWRFLGEPTEITIPTTADEWMNVARLIIARQQTTSAA